MTYLDIPDLEAVPGENGRENLVSVADDLLQLHIVEAIAGKRGAGRRRQSKDSRPAQGKIHF